MIDYHSRSFVLLSSLVCTEYGTKQPYCLPPLLQSRARVLQERRPLAVAKVPLPPFHKLLTRCEGIDAVAIFRRKRSQGGDFPLAVKVRNQHRFAPSIDGFPVEVEVPHDHAVGGHFCGSPRLDGISHSSTKSIDNECVQLAVFVHVDVGAGLE